MPMLILILTMFGLSPALHAQDATQPKPDAGSLLSGPSVSEGDIAGSLVETGYDGSMRPLDSTPEEAALRLLDLTDEQRAGARAVIDRRAREMDGFVIGNLLLLTELKSARASGEQKQIGSVLREIMSKMRETGLSMDHTREVADALPEDFRGEFISMVTERRDAESEARSGEMGGEEARGGGGRRGAAMRSRIMALGTELRFAYERVAQDRSNRLETFLAELGLDAATESRVRGMIVTNAQRSAGVGAPGREALLREIYQTLPADAQRRLIELYREERP